MAEDELRQPEKSSCLVVWWYGTNTKLVCFSIAIFQLLILNNHKYKPTVAMHSANSYSIKKILIKIVDFFLLLASKSASQI